MNRDSQNSDDTGNGAVRGAATPRGDAEETLRLIARLPAPAGLEGRIHHKLRATLRMAPRTAAQEGRVLAWPMPARAGREWMRAAAAAAIAFVIAGGGWGVYSRVQPRTAGPMTLAPHAAPGGFAGAGAVRTPQTLNGPVLNGPAPNGPVPNGRGLTGPAPASPLLTHPADARLRAAPLPAKDAQKNAAHTAANAPAGKAGTVAPASSK